MARTMEHLWTPVLRQTHVQTCKAGCDVVARGPGQDSEALLVAQTQQGTTLSPPFQPSQRLAGSSVPDAPSGPAGARQHYHRPGHRQKAQAFQGPPWDHTARQPAQAVTPSADGRGPAPLVSCSGSRNSSPRGLSLSSQLRGEGQKNGPHRGCFQLQSYQPSPVPEKDVLLFLRAPV